MELERVVDPALDAGVADQRASIGALNNRLLPALCLGTFVAGLTGIAPAPLFPVMARDLDVGVPLLGQLVTAMMLVSAPLALIAGPLADRCGYRRPILLGLVAAAACFVTLGLAPAFAVLLLAGLFGALADATVPALSLAVAGTRFAGSASRRAIGQTTAAMAGAAIVGVPILTTASDVVGWRTACLGTAVVAIGVAALAARWLPRDDHRAGVDAMAPIAAYRAILGDRAMRRLYGSSALRAVCWYGLLTYLGAFLVEELGQDARQVGLIYMAGGAGYFLGSLTAGGPLAWVAPRPLLAGTNAAMALFLGPALSGAFGTAGTVSLLVLACIAAGLGWVGLAATLVAGTPAGTGATMTLNGAIFNLGAAGGGAAGGLLLALGGYGGLALGLPILALAAAAMAWWSSY